MKVQAILPTAGAGTRFSSAEPKSLVTLAGKPLFVHALRVFESCPEVDSVILVVPPAREKDFEQIVREYALGKVRGIIAGGARRCDSVSRAVKILDRDTEIVVIHDGARPLLSSKILDQSIQLCQEHGAVVVGVPVKATIKKVDPLRLVVRETPNREEFWEIQTPQVFKADLLQRAYKQDLKDDVTDDAALVERLGVPVKVLPGEYKNIKITTGEDLKIAEIFLKEENS